MTEPSNMRQWFERYDMESDHEDPVAIAGADLCRQVEELEMRLARAYSNALQARADCKEAGDIEGMERYAGVRDVCNSALTRVRAILASTPDDKEDAELQPAEAPRPMIVCLCGSTRFMDAFHQANRELSLEGKIVLTVEIVTYDGATDPQRADPEQKHTLDVLHLRKIDLADEVLVLNVGDYIGESTAQEIAYARQRGKTIRFLEPGDQPAEAPAQEQAGGERN